MNAEASKIVSVIIYAVDETGVLNVASQHNAEGLVVLVQPLSAYEEPKRDEASDDRLVD